MTDITRRGFLGGALALTAAPAAAKDPTEPGTLFGFTLTDDLCVNGSVIDNEDALRVFYKSFDPTTPPAEFFTLDDAELAAVIEKINDLNDDNYSKITGRRGEVTQLRGYAEQPKDRLARTLQNNIADGNRISEDYHPLYAEVLAEAATEILEATSPEDKVNDVVALEARLRETREKIAADISALNENILSQRREMCIAPAR